MPVKYTLESWIKAGFIDIHERLPAFSAVVEVGTPSFRCLAVLQSDGSWREAGKKRQIQEVLAWKPFIARPF